GVPALLTLAPAAATAQPKQRVRFSGSASPAKPRRLLAVQQQFGRRWRTIAHIRLDRHSRFAFRHGFTADGAKQLRVLLGADSRNSAAASNSAQITVGPVPTSTPDIQKI